MSSERHFSNKPYRPSRKKKSYWKPVLFLVLLGGALVRLHPVLAHD